MKLVWQRSVYDPTAVFAQTDKGRLFVKPSVVDKGKIIALLNGLDLLREWSNMAEAKAELEQEFHA